MASRLSWFLTPAGKKFSFGFMCTASCAAFAVQFVPYTFGLYKFKEIVSMYQAAVPVPVAEDVLKRWNEVLVDLSLPKHEVKYLEPFTVFGFDVFRAGSINSRWGAIIGIPINFTYKDVATIDSTPIRVGDEPVNWNRQDAKELLESLVLSEDAQRYGIAREVLMARHDDPLIRSALAAFMISSTYLLSHSTNDKFKLLERPLPIRGIWYVVAALFSFGIYTVQVDLINAYFEKEAEAHIAQLGDRYKRGAIEYYDQMLKKNIALRSLLGAQGESAYTRKGNERFIFRQPRLPIDQRRQYFVDALDGNKKKAEGLDEKEVAAAPA